MGVCVSNTKAVEEPSTEKRSSTPVPRESKSREKQTSGWVGGEGAGPARDASGRLDLDAARQYASAGKPVEQKFDPAVEYGPNGNIGAFAEEIPDAEGRVQKMVMHNGIWIEERAAVLYSDYRQKDITNEVAKEKLKQGSRKWCPYCRRLFPDQCLCDDGMGEERREKQRRAKTSRTGSKKSMYSPPASWRGDLTDPNEHRGKRIMGSPTTAVGGAFLRDQLRSAPSRSSSRESAGSIVNWRTMSGETLAKYNMKSRDEARLGSPMGSPVPRRRAVKDITTSSVRPGQWLSDDSD